MTHQLTQKERMLLEDHKKQEELCIQKYQNYATQTQDPQLKQLLNSYAQQEQQHLNSVNQLLSGRIPSVSEGRQQQMFAPESQGVTPQISPGQQRDATLVNDLLMTEKYVSGSYDTAIFEFTNPQMRQVLNHIQKEEQQHGEGLFNYLNDRGLYNPQ